MLSAWRASPCGTEPKAKAYVEVGSAPWPADAPAAAWQRTRREVDQTAQHLGDAFVALALGLVGLKPPAKGGR